MITKSNLTLCIDYKVLEKFYQLKGNTKISHLVQSWLIDFIEKEERSPTKHHQGERTL